MTPPTPRKLEREALARIVRRVGAAPDPEQAFARTAPLRRALPQGRAADALAAVLTALPPGRALELGRSLLALHPGRPAVVAGLGEAFEHLTDVDDLNAAPPDDPWFAAVVDRLGALADTTGSRHRDAVLEALATAARRLGHRGDRVAERAHAELLALAPDDPGHHYGHGLFLKTRGRFAEGVAANRRALALGLDTPAVWWNLGLCATGAGDGATALEAWRHLGQHVAPGRFGLPEGRYPMAKIQVAERPFAERGADDDTPGREENLWVERLAGGHGIVRSAVLDDAVGVEYGDVVLFDGAPLGYHGDQPLFPHLATLRRQRYQVWPFVGTQVRSGQLGDLSAQLPEDAVVYSHTEKVVILCNDCARGSGEPHVHDPDPDHPPTHRVVRGKVCAPPSVTPPALLAALDAALASSPGARLLTPELCRDAGRARRARNEERERSRLEADREDA